MKRISNENERRVLVLAPTNRDALLTRRILKQNQIDAEFCTDIPSVMKLFESGAGALLLPEEVVLKGQSGPIAELVARQPAWSDLPIILLTRHDSDSPALVSALATLGNVTLLERPTGVMALVAAVRHAVRARERQYHARALLVERELANLRKDEFLATLAHELRNPLAPIRNSLQILRLTACQDEGSQHICEMMERQVNLMVRLVDDLMEVSRITRGKIEIRREPVDVAMLIHSAVETSRPVIDAAQTHLEVSVPAETITVFGDPMRLSQVFSNLLNNAAKYTNQRGEIWVTASVQGKYVEVSIRDTGIGIPSDMLPYIFDMFMQVDRSAGRAQGGLGIGLTLVRTLVELHGGAIEVRSEGTGRGSEFIVRLPIAQREATPAPVAANPRVTEVPARRILVVDDNVDAAASLGMLLEVLGAEVRTEHDGPAALATIDSYRPDVVLLDIGMPGMDGFQVAERIRSQPDSKHVLLIALTGWGQEEDRRRTREAGFDHHLVKPADVKTLRNLLTQMS
jgi:signal transduction histidine kinase/CheY-like chemotaxis protein